MVGTAAAIGLGLAATSAAVNTGMSLSQASEGRRRQKEAEKDLDAYSRQELTNVYAGMSAPTEGMMLRTQQLQQNVADYSANLSQAGARGVIGGMPSLMRESDQAMAQIQASLEESQFKMQQMIAEDEARIRGMRETREQQDLAGLGAEIQAGRDQYYQGVAGASQSMGQLGSSMYGLAGPGTGGTTTKTATTTPKTDKVTPQVAPPSQLYEGRGYGKYGA